MFCEFCKSETLDNDFPDGWEPSANLYTHEGKYLGQSSEICPICAKEMGTWVDGDFILSPRCQYSYRYNVVDGRVYFSRIH